MPESTPVDLAAARARIQRAHAEIREVARNGRTRWQMSIPANPERDTDLIISVALADGERLAGEVERLTALIRDLADPDPCWFDHHGGCQAHGYLSLEPGERCPHAEAKDLLGAEEQTGGGDS